jgi:hypothetical protein
MNSSDEFSTPSQNRTFNIDFIDGSIETEIEVARNITKVIDQCVFNESYVISDQSYISHNRSFNRTIMATSDNGTPADDVSTRLANDNVNSHTYSVKTAPFRRSNTLRKRCKKVCASMISKFMKRPLTTDDKKQTKLGDQPNHFLNPNIDFYNPYPLAMNANQVNFNRFGDIVIWHV